jgi:hypothetical protein
MQDKPNNKRRLILAIVAGIAGLCLLTCIGIYALGKWAESDPSVQATGTARAGARQTGTAEAIALATRRALPTSTFEPSVTPTMTAVPTNTSTPSPTETMDPSITPPTSTPTPTATHTNTPTATGTKTATATRTPPPTKTPLPSKTPIPTKTFTPVPPAAGLTDWIVYQGKKVGVRDLSWNKYLSYYRPDQGKIYVSLYIVAINESDSETTFFENDFELVDGGGEITGGVIFGRKEPEFNTCTVKPGGTCEGWWTTMIWDRPEVKADLTFRWDPCLIFCDAMEIPIQQP